MFENRRVINRILKLRYKDNLSYRAISENMRSLKVTHKEYTKNINETYGGVSIDYRTIKRICKYYEPWKDEYLNAVSKKSTSAFFNKHPPSKQPRQGSTLSKKQILLCKKYLANFIESCSERTYHQLSYKSYYEYLIDQHGDEFTFVYLNGNDGIFSYASMLPYLKKIYNPYDFIKET